MQYTLSSIGTIHTDFKERFGTPRQSLMVQEAPGLIKLIADPNFHNALKDLEKFSHLWLIYLFHQNIEKSWKPMITPPRLDTKKIGVFASRSPYRPNPIGLSAVKLQRINFQAQGGIEIHVKGVDILDQSPLIDIKPYLPYADLISDAKSGWAQSEIPKYPVEFSPESLEKLKSYSDEDKSSFLNVLKEVLELDPRPTSQRQESPIHLPESEGIRFGFNFSKYDVQMEIRNQKIYVLEMLDISRI